MANFFHIQDFTILHFGAEIDTKQNKHDISLVVSTFPYLRVFFLLVHAVAVSVGVVGVFLTAFFPSVQRSWRLLEASIFVDGREAATFAALARVIKRRIWRRRSLRRFGGPLYPHMR